MLHCNKKYHDFQWENKDYSMTTINTIFAFRTILRTHWPVILPKLTVTKGIVINKMASTSLQFHQTGYNLGSFFKDISQILHTTVWGLCKYYANTHFPDLFLKWQYSMNFLNSFKFKCFPWIYVSSFDEDGSGILWKKQSRNSQLSPTRQWPKTPKEQWPWRNSQCLTRVV